MLNLHRQKLLKTQTPRLLNFKSIFSLVHVAACTKQTYVLCLTEGYWDSWIVKQRLKVNKLELNFMFNDNERKIFHNWS